MKYDMELDELLPNTSQEKILKQVRKGSRVLECGCATGYMTRYMTEKLDAEVYIVEYDQNAFEVAQKYAADGICADLMRDDWVRRFEGKQFDYILFVDVLEHVYDPLSVLKKAVKFLAPDGAMLLSLPNIAHNDILINLYNGNWRYTELGLLDDTHIRFWAESNLDSFCEQAGLYIERQDCTTVSTFRTEQLNDQPVTDSSLFPLLRQRKDGEIYQFILTARRADYGKDKDIQKEIMPRTSEEFYSRLYYAGDGENFCDARSCCRMIRGKDVDFNVKYQFKGMGVRRLRFDPIEGTGCVVKNVQAVSDRGRLETANLNGLRLGAFDVFLTEDPQLDVQTDQRELDSVEIQGRVIVLEENMREVVRELMESHRNLQQEADRGRARAAELETALSAALKQSADEKAELETALSAALKQTADEKEELRRAAEGLRQEKIRAERDLESSARELEKARAVNQSILLSASWKMTAPVRCLLDKIKRVR